MLIFGTSSGQVVDLGVPFSGQAVDLGVPNSGQAVGRLYKHNKTIVNSYKLQKPKNENQVLSFFKKQKWSEMDARKFFNHYESTGWKLGGKVQIENWQATAKNWMIKAAEIALKTKTIENASQLSQNRDNLHTTRNKDYNQPL